MTPIRKQKAFSLLELMVVVAILGIIASIAVPNFQKSVAHYRATANAREVLSAVTGGRGLSQRNNAPVEVTFGLRTVSIAPATVTGTAAEVRKTVTGYGTARVITLPGDVRIVRLERLAANGTVASTQTPPTASMRFCSTSDAYYRDNTAARNPICGIGNLASDSVKIVFTTAGETWHVRVNAALGNVELKAGA